MRTGTALAIVLATLVSPGLKAQSAHFGVAVNLVVPTGGFYNTTYAPGTVTPASQNPIPVSQKEGYDVGAGIQFWISLPVDPRVAFRLEFTGQSVRGTNTAVGYQTVHLRHELFGIAGEIQVFPGAGSAVRHKGTYLLGGLSADFERFDQSLDGSFNDNNYYQNGYYSQVDTERKNRMAVIAGVGHSFGYGAGGRFNLEATYHKTVTGHDFSNGDRVAADFLRLGFGWVF